MVPVVTAWDTDRDLQDAGYVVFPEERYVDPDHCIDWAVILWRCTDCGSERHAPGPGEACHCLNGHGPMHPSPSPLAEEATDR